MKDNKIRKTKMTFPSFLCKECESFIKKEIVDKPVFTIKEHSIYCLSKDRFLSALQNIEYESTKFTKDLMMNHIFYVTEYDENNDIDEHFKNLCAFLTKNNFNLNSSISVIIFDESIKIIDGE